MRIKREELLNILNLLQPGLSPQAVVEQSDCVVFRGKYAMTYNDEVACWIHSPLKGIEGAVAAKPLIELLQKMKEEEIEVESRDGEFYVVGKGRRAGIRMDAEITLPIETVEQPTAWKSLPEDFCEAIGIVEACAGNDEDKFNLTCVHIHPKWVEATDNFQAARYRIKTGVVEAALVKRKNIRHIVSLGMTEFAETETWIHFRNPAKLVVSCRRFTEDFESLKELLSVTGTEVKLPRGLAEAAERAEVFAADNASDSDNKWIMVELLPGKIRIKGLGTSGWYSETKKTAYSGPKIRFTISSRMLGELVKQHTSCEISDKIIKVDAGKFKWVTVLGVPDDDKSE